MQPFAKNEWVVGGVAPSLLDDQRTIMHSSVGSERDLHRPAESDIALTLSASALSAFGLSRHQRADASTQTTNTISRPPRPPKTVEVGRIRWPADKAATPQPPGAYAASPRRKSRVKLCSSKLCLPQFSETPEGSVVRMLMTALLHTNARGSGCCSFHVTVARCAKALQGLSGRACLSPFQPVDAWQCAKCLALNDPLLLDDSDEQRCRSCGSTEKMLPIDLETVILSSTSEDLESEESGSDSNLPMHHDHYRMSL